jgi:hypothetical protein
MSDSDNDNMDTISDDISTMSLSDDIYMEWDEFSQLINQFYIIEQLHKDAIASCESIQNQLENKDIIHVSYMGKTYTFDEMLDELHDSASYNIEQSATNNFSELLLKALECASFH